MTQYVLGSYFNNMNIEPQYAVIFTQPSCSHYQLAIDLSTSTPRVSMKEIFLQNKNIHLLCIGSGPIMLDNIRKILRGAGVMYIYTYTGCP